MRCAQQAVGGDPGHDLAYLFRIKNVHVGESHLALQRRGLSELGHDFRLSGHEQVAVGVPRDRGVEDALSRAPELEPSPRQLDLQGCAELLADTAERAAGGTAAQLAGLDTARVGMTFAPPGSAAAVAATAPAEIPL